jgi:hypothetical protein
MERNGIANGNVRAPKMREGGQGSERAAVENVSNIRYHAQNQLKRPYSLSSNDTERFNVKGTRLAQASFNHALKLDGRDVEARFVHRKGRSINLECKEAFSRPLRGRRDQLAGEASDNSRASQGDI